MKTLITIVAVLALSAHAQAQSAGTHNGIPPIEGVIVGDQPPSLENYRAMDAADQLNRDWTGAEIIEKAHRAAGGENWVRPGSLYLTGYNLIRSPEGALTIWDEYSMWRVFGDEKADAHAANGKVRIEGKINGEYALLLAFDGQTTYTQDGPMEGANASTMWSNSFGFGAIRNALDEGWTQTRKPDRNINGQPAYMVELTDPTGNQTLFGIAQGGYAVLYVGFETPRGWHERYYDNFFSKQGISWVQPGRVTLVYDGVVANEAIWTDFEIGADYPDALFVVEKP